MASVISTPNGHRVIQFRGADGKRKTLRLGKMAGKDAAAVNVHVERLISVSFSGHSVQNDTAAWLTGIGAVLRKRLVKVGLIQAEKPRESVTLGTFLADYVASRSDAKVSTHLVFGHTRRCLTEYFGEARPIESVTPTEAEAWRGWLVSDQKLAPNTVRRRTGIARQFFNAARKRGLLTDNPFNGLAAAVHENRSRAYFVTHEQTAAILDACPDLQWRLLIALARFGGVRMPSEALGIRWGDCDWERGRFTVHSPKTAHHPGGASRSVPIFPELLPLLRDAFDRAEPGTEYVITRYRDTTQNVGTQLRRIITKAGLKPWPKLWQNMRASRETELVERWPVHVVCTWLGNSPVVATKHYLQTTEAHYHEASALQKATLQSAITDCKAMNGSRADDGEPAFIASKPQIALQCASSQNGGMGDTGLEPVTPSV